MINLTMSSPISGIMLMDLRLLLRVCIGEAPADLQSVQFMCHVMMLSHEMQTTFPENFCHYSQKQTGENIMAKKHKINKLSSAE